MKPVRLFNLLHVFVSFLDLTAERAHLFFQLLFVQANLCTKNKGLCAVRELPIKTTAPLFSALMFVGFHNQSPLLTILNCLFAFPDCAGKILKER